MDANSRPATPQFVNHGKERISSVEDSELVEAVLGENKPKVPLFSQNHGHLTERESKMQPTVQENDLKVVKKSNGRGYTTPVSSLKNMKSNQKSINDRHRVCFFGGREEKK